MRLLACFIISISPLEYKLQESKELCFIESYNSFIRLFLSGESRRKLYKMPASTLDLHCKIQDMLASSKMVDMVTSIIIVAFDAYFYDRSFRVNTK